MNFWVYIVECGDGSFYTGQTGALPTRVLQHRQGLGANHTRLHLPVRLVWARAVPDRESAMALEAQIKKWSRVKKLALITSDWEPAARAHREWNRVRDSRVRAEGSLPGASLSSAAASSSRSLVEGDQANSGPSPSGLRPSGRG